MKNIFFESKGKIIFLVITVYLLLNASCSKHLYPEPSFQNITTRAEKKKLEVFMNAGIEKGINAQKTSADDIIKTAQKFIGVPHCMGGTTVKCMDCSGLLVAVFAKYGIHLPHNSEEQARYGKIISRPDELKRGDLIFFIESYKTHRLITHSGIYVGNNNFIHTSSKKGVTITSLKDPWWSKKFVFGTRVLK
ncbi:MAG: C40 family peptidase [Bacteroidales bacterium]|nr:C40 family peptidase [Bacteroidales bacterium]